VTSKSSSRRLDRVRDIWTTHLYVSRINKNLTWCHLVKQCNTPQHTATYCNTPQICNALQHTCNILATHIRQKTAKHCSTLQHTATHSNAPVSKMAPSGNTYDFETATLESENGCSSKKNENHCVWHSVCCSVRCSVLQCVLKIAAHGKQKLTRISQCVNISFSKHKFENHNALTQVATPMLVCCSVLQCVAVCCSVLQCVAVCCSVLQCVAACRSVLQSVAVCYSVLQYAAVCCSVGCRMNFGPKIERFLRIIFENSKILQLYQVLLEFNKNCWRRTSSAGVKQVLS